MFKSFTARDRKPAARPGRALAPDTAPPAPVRRAVRLMRAGAAVSTLSLIFTVISSFSLKSNMMSANAQKLRLHQITESQISSTASALIIYTIIIGLVSVGLWVWMARKNEAGRNWARMTASAFFGLWSLYTYSVLGELHGGVTVTATLIVSLILILALWVIGVVTVFHLWRPASTAYFKAPSLSRLRLEEPLVADVVLAAVPTPFHADGSLDHDGARRLFEFVAGRLDGLFVTGTTGEFPALDTGERLALIEIALEAAGPERVIAHIGAPDSYHATRLAREAVLLGATRLAAITPYYLAPNPAEVTSYYLRIRDAAPDAELYAYIFPERTGLTVGPQQFCELADNAGLAGAKFSGSAARNVAECAAARPGLRIFSGNDTDLAATLRGGGAGVISARSSAFPEVFAALSAALAAPDGGAGGGAAAARQEDVAAIVGLGQSIGLVKTALRVRGFVPMAARMAVAEPDEATAARVAELVKRLVAVP